MATLFITVKKWKQLKCPSTHERANKIGSIHMMEYYSVIKRSEIVSLPETLMDLETWTE